MSRELVVLSHLRWVFVWQRPQHLISRLATGYDRTWFVEEPLTVAGLTEPVLQVEEVGTVTRVWLQVPGPERSITFDDPAAALYEDLLPRLLGDGVDRTLWLYTPAALDLGRRLLPDLVVYDVMDDLAAFKGASRSLVLRQRQALREAHIVFTGGRSLHRGIVEHRSEGAHCFPSGVEPEHYAAALDHRAPRERPVAGYVGVIDERIDLDLVGGLAAALPDWDIQMVGPVAKIDEADLPTAPNISYPGPKPYPLLPRVMGGFDVALMPFALNEATKSISPTKTLEYLAAGLPVISTRVPDVVADYEPIVHLADNAAEFADGCRHVLGGSREVRAARVRPVLRRQHWDTIASRMASLIEAVREPAPERVVHQKETA
jgi:glycosyltransferase involved in cell wall biosynthesis